MDNNAKKQRNILVVLLIVIVMIMAGMVIFFLVSKNDTENVTDGPSLGMAVESNIILDDPKTLQDAVDEMIKKAEEGRMTLEMKVDAYSSDGESFKCYLANAKENNYDMFMVLYLDEDQNEIYRSGLIPIGARIESFETSYKLKAGTHVGTLTFYQVEEDGETIHSQVNVGLNMYVSE